MKFKDSFFYCCIVEPIKSWAALSPYYMALSFPLLLIVVAFMLVLWIPVDGTIACKELWRAIR